MGSVKNMGESAVEATDNVTTYIQIPTRQFSLERLTIITKFGGEITKKYSGYADAENIYIWIEVKKIKFPRSFKNLLISSTPQCYFSNPHSLYEGDCPMHLVTVK
jgi:hypothetical protein